VVQDSQDNLVHILPQPEVDLFLLLQGFHQLKRMGRMGQSCSGAYTPGFAVGQCLMTQGPRRL
jgi:hypothetical protein